MNRYVDIYTNILPTMPTAGQSAPTMEQALARITTAEQTSTKIMIAAPCYEPAAYASLDAFFEQRHEMTMKMCAESASLAHPVRILEGSVLHYTPDLLSYGEKLRRFSIADSGYMLMDLPEMSLNEAFYDDMKKLKLVSGLTPILCDFDRFYNLFTLEDFFAFHEAELLIQISADGLVSPEKRKLSLYLLANQHVHFIASGSQTADSPVSLSDAMRIVQRSLPSEIYRRIKNNTGMLLSDASPSEFL